LAVEEISVDFKNLSQFEQDGLRTGNKSNHKSHNKSSLVSVEVIEQEVQELANEYAQSLIEKAQNSALSH